MGDRGGRGAAGTGAGGSWEGGGAYLTPITGGGLLDDNGEAVTATSAPTTFIGGRPPTNASDGDGPAGRTMRLCE
eukprot:gene12203-biopygen552